MGVDCLAMSLFEIAPPVGDATGMSNTSSNTALSTIEALLECNWTRPTRLNRARDSPSSVNQNTRRPTEMIDPSQNWRSVVPTSSVKYQSLQRRLLRSLPLRWSLR